MTSYYFIDYCPQCGDGYKVCRTSDFYEYSVNRNWHNVDTVNIWSFDNYEDAMRFAKSRSDKIGIVETSSRARTHRDRKQNYVNFPITQRRDRVTLSADQEKQRAVARNRAQALGDAIYLINLYGSKEQAIEAIRQNQKYWSDVADKYDNIQRGSYVA